MMTQGGLEIEAGPLAIDARHGREFRIDRPHGSRDWVLIHFPRSVRIRDRQGERVTRADACILHAPQQPQWFCAVGEGLVNHYTHLRGSGVMHLVERLRLPTGIVVYPRPVDFIATHIQEMLRERMREDPQSKIIFAGLAMSLLASFSRRLRRVDPVPPPRVRSAHERIGDVRARMRAEPWLVWNVAGMARLAKLSTSRFRALYRQLHRTNAKAELNAARVERARQLLVDAPLSIARIAAACGFADPQYFSRVFRNLVGCSPSGYVIGLTARKQRRAARK